MVVVHAYIEVTDAEPGIAFYCEGFGLRLQRRLSPTWIELAGANLAIFLLANRSPVGDLGSTTATRNYARHWTPVHLDFIVEDLDVTIALLTALGGTLDRPVKQREYGRIANMADPFGNGFDVIEFSAAGYNGVRRAG